MKHAKIYGLIDSEGVIRSIGKTERSLGLRLQEHLSESRKKERKNSRCIWLRGLLQLPRIALIEEFPFQEKHEWSGREVYWIALARAYGHDLVNGNEGGHGGANPSAAAREKMAAAQRGRKQSAESVAKRAAMLRGRKQTQEQIEKAAATRRGKKRSPQTIAKVAAANRGKKRGLATCQKLSAAVYGRKHTRASSLFHGIFWHTRSCRWRVQIYHNKKNVYIGSFRCEIIAACAADAYVRANGLSPKLLNFP